MIAYYLSAAYAIHRAIDDPSVVYVSDLLQQQHDFCGSKEVQSKYGPLVGQACGLLLTADPDSGLREALLRRFESTPDGQWGGVISPPLLHLHKKDVSRSHDCYYLNLFPVALRFRHTYRVLVHTYMYIYIYIYMYIFSTA
jgi:hypothetical protein